MRVGFIGLGNMGGPMALNLIKAGHSLIVFDVRREAAKAQLPRRTCRRAPSGRTARRRWRARAS